MRTKRNLNRWITGALLVLCTLAIGEANLTTWKVWQSDHGAPTATAYTVAAQQSTLQDLTLVEAMVNSVQNLASALRSGNLKALFSGESRITQPPTPCSAQQNRTVTVKYQVPDLPDAPQDYAL